MWGLRARHDDHVGYPYSDGNRAYFADGGRHFRREVGLSRALRLFGRGVCIAVGLVLLGMSGLMGG